MKKFFPIILGLTVLLVQTVSAQSDFKFVQTTFVGALDTASADNWTTGWANWDPKTTNYAAPTDTTTLNGMLATLPVQGEADIFGVVTLDASKVYLLKGFVVVRAGGKLIIPAGTLIRAQADLNATPKNYASILVERGGDIEINGSSTSPVVITSAQAAGSRERGDWGGLVIAGFGTHNLYTNNNVQMEGFNGVGFDANLAKFGGNDPADNSGKVTYLRLEFSGLAFEPNREINGLTFGAVGSATTINHIQVSFCNDDSYEWFGGSVNCSHLIAYKGTDDDFDTDNGYSGLCQFGIGVRDSAYYDLSYLAPSGSSTSEGFESDNEASGTAAVTSYTSAIFSNFTMVGPVPVGMTWGQMGSVTRAAFRRGARIRRNSSERIVNSIFMGYRNFLMIDGDSAQRNTNWPSLRALLSTTGPIDTATKMLFYSNNLVINTGAAFGPASSTANGLVESSSAGNSADRVAALDAWVRQSGPLANNIDPVAFTEGTLLINPSAFSTTPDFRPVSGSPALSGANFKNNPILRNLYLNLTGVDKEVSIEFAPIYPNPMTNGVLNFGRFVESYGIFDVQGNLITFGVDTDRAELKNLAAGLYIIKLDGEAQRLIVK